ncbi:MULTISPECIES: L,D-transpeptidase [Micromonospora]|uniref:Murein L,D-transpeptidase n=1 Tax=Micromonospora solifontis TaxID=2487138 RepID=A0ABX9WFF0_9ACTN|nr:MULTISPECIES: L,D-transpeptidase [Micromonospora]NES13893.1 L,D-transpeptidase [Micromonospora sp. PPF5-17B]NES37962.1 L,D-transpeptidase [Micromonospora solifontis]NES53993.1 L,D-transpeptidase [Micromonospora sp. PPF5-6]RNL97809.1 murein L,D-transpeptidase [Micromonospora solifontis]
MLFDRLISRWTLGWLLAAFGVPLLLAAALLVGRALTVSPAPAPVAAAPRTPATADPSPTPTESVPPAAPAPDDLPVVTYDPAPGGFPADPGAADTRPVTEGLAPKRTIAAYDAPGGRPRAFLAPTISDVPLTMPIVDRRVGWTAVLLPSANRRIAWLPAGGWDTVTLRDQLVVERRPHRLTWYRDGRAVHSWQVSLGMTGQSTPLGRTFILGRTPPPQEVYGGVDIFALGAIPDDPDAVPTGLRGAHIGLHSWHNDDTLGENVTNGCIRLTRSGQRQLLAEVRPGTAVVVVD